MEKEKEQKKSFFIEHPITTLFIVSVIVQGAVEIVRIIFGKNE